MTDSKEIAKRIRSSFQIALERHEKIATGDTLRSIEVRDKVTANYVRFEVYAGDGFKFVQWGKRANTKLPVYKEGGKFHLVKPLARWKKARGLTMPDFLLARSIAKNPRAGIDLIGEAEKDMETYLSTAMLELMDFEDSLLLKSKKI